MGLSKFSIVPEQDKLSQFSVGEEPLSQFSVSDEEETTLGGIIKSIGAGLTAGVVSLGSQLGDLEQIIEDIANIDPEKEPLTMSIVQGALAPAQILKARSPVLEAITGSGHTSLGEESKKAQAFLRKFTGDTKAEQLVGQASESIGRIGATAAALLATGGSTAGLLPALAGGAGVEKTAESLREGAPRLNAYGAGFVQAATEYLTEKIPIGILQKPGLSFIKRLAGGVISDIPGELIATATELSLIDKQILGKDRHLSTDEYVQILKDTAAVSAIATVGLTGGAQIGHKLTTVDALNKMAPVPPQKVHVPREKAEILPENQIRRETSKSQYPELQKQDNLVVQNSALQLKPTTADIADTTHVEPESVSELPQHKDWSSIMDAGRAMSLKKRKLTFDKVWKGFVKGFVDVSGNLQKQLSDLGNDGKRAVMRQNAIGGASTKGTKEANIAKKPIYDGLNSKNKQLFDDYISALRHLEIRQNRGAEFTLPGNATEQMLNDFIRDIPEQTRTQLERRAEAWSQSMGNVLNLMQSEGLITPEQAVGLREQGRYYVPRQVLDFIDPLVQVKNKQGKTITTRDSGLKNLSEDGSDKLIETDSELLMEQVFQRAYTRIFRNRAGLELLNLARTDPNARKIARDAGPKETAKPNEMKVSVMEDGVRREMIMPLELGTEWVTGDPILSSTWATIIGWGSGNKILKSMATTLNPEFAITNVPRDLAHIWLTTEEYSSLAPVATLQMAGDISAIVKDSIKAGGITKTALYDQYIDNGGGMEFLTHRGKLGLKGTSALTKGISALETVLGKAGEVSETMTRLALMRRAMRNKRTPFEATQIARGYLDFARGGAVAKAINSAVPFFNAGIQATRGIARAARTNPKLFGSKVAQIGAMSVGLYLANRLYGDDIDDVPDFEQQNNWVFLTPYTFLDSEGRERRYYVRIPKDQGQRVFATIAENSTRKVLGEQVNWPDITESVGNFLPIIPGELLPPLAEMTLGYSVNKDFWTKEDIWRGEEVLPQDEYNKYTPEPFVKFGEVTGFSPARTQYMTEQLFTRGNIWTSAVGYASKQIFDEMTPEERDKMSKELFEKHPGVRRVLRSTRPDLAEIKKLKEEKIRVETERLRLNRQLDEVTDRFFRGQTDEREVSAFILSVPFEERKRLRNRFNAQRQLKDVSNKGFWFRLLDLPPEARAVNYWNSWVQLDPEAQKELDRQSFKVPGLRSKRFNNRLRKMRKFGAQIGR
jgi:hypothetical protein